MSKIKLNSARIKVHRYCAFSDIPVFSERHCDLKKATPMSTDLSDQGSVSLSPCCGSSLPAIGSVAASSESSVSPSPSYSGIIDSPPFAFPFTSNDSSRLCLKSGLSIAKAFGSLPIPCPVTSPMENLATRDWTHLPRTMPSFACCAMQSAYALLNLHHKAFVMIGNSANDHQITNLLTQCEEGLQSILAALDNYSMSFEALSGMRGKFVSTLHNIRDI